MDREKKVLAILEQELRDGEDMANAARELAGRLLRDKGYGPEDVKRNVVFDVSLPEDTVSSSVDFVVSINGVKAMMVKCAAGSISSRERQAVAAARLLGEFRMPVAVVMDPFSAVVISAFTGKTIGEGFGAVPDKAELGRMLASAAPVRFSEKHIEREKRILLAFDAIACSVPQGANGGVHIQEDK